MQVAAGRPQDRLRTGAKRDAVIAALAEPRTAVEVATLTGEPVSSIKAWIAWLQRAGRVARVDRVKATTRINGGAGRVSGQWQGVYQRKG